MPAQGSRLRAWCALSCALALGAGTLAAQAPEQMRFEVASVKPHPDSGDTRVGIEENEGFVRIVNLPLRNIVAIAYDVMPAAVNGPAWLDRRRFDITAKPPDGYQRRQLPIVLRNLLADRFKLVAGREKREGRRVPARPLNRNSPSSRPCGNSSAFDWSRRDRTSTSWSCRASRRRRRRIDRRLLAPSFFRHPR